MERPWLAWIKQKSAGVGWREAAALVVSISITIAIFWLREPIARLDSLSYAGAFLVMLVTSATLVLPANGLSIVFLLGGTLGSPLLLGVIAGIGSTLGEVTGYLVGYGGHNLVDQGKTYQKIKHYLERHAFWTVFVLALIPNPLFDFAGIAAGALRLAWWRFFSATTLGKVLKMIIVAYAGKYSIGWIEKLL